MSSTYYYPLVKHRSFGSLDAFCKRGNLDKTYVEKEILDAHMRGSDLVVLREMVLGEPEQEMRGVLTLHPNGAVTLWTGLLGEMSKEWHDVLATIAVFEQHEDFKNKTFAIATFKPDEGALH